MSPLPPAAPSAAPPGTQRTVLRVVAAVVLLVLMFSLVSPVLAVRLQAQGHSAAAIGFVLMLPFATVACALPLLPRLFARFGLGPVLRAGLALETLATGLYLLSPDFRWVCAAGVLCGLGAAAAWNGTEALIAHHAPPAARGRWTGLYQTALGGALALGPFLPGLLGLGTQAALGLALAGQMGAVLMCLGPAVDALQASPPGAPARGSGWALRQRPGLVWCALVGGVFEAGLAALSAAQGAALGWSLGAATALAGVLGVGSFLLQYPAGHAADRVGARPLLAGAAALLLLATLPLALGAPAEPWLWPAVAAWGGVGGALYTLTMVRTAQAFASQSALAGTAAVIGGYTVGGAIGPLISGSLLDRAGLPGLASGLCLLALSVALLAWRERPAAGPAASGPAG